MWVGQKKVAYVLSELMKPYSNDILMLIFSQGRILAKMVLTTTMMKHLAPLSLPIRTEKKRKELGEVIFSNYLQWQRIEFLFLPVFTLFSSPII